MNCQPIFFVGAGLSRRFFSAPGWIDLLKTLKGKCPTIRHDVEYYLQDGKKLDEVGEIYSEAYREWAWSDGREYFPQDLFQAGTPRDAYIKYDISRMLSEITPESIDEISDEHTRREINQLINTHPHAIITTNYDTFLETMFPDFQPVVGQNILAFDQFWIGEIYKIHGCVNTPESLVFHKSDYSKFMERKKYLSAKLLTYMVEHPIFFIGYGAEDDNIKAILSDLNEILYDSGRNIADNMYFLNYDKTLDSSSTPPIEDIIALENNRRMRINVIHYSNLDWILSALSSEVPLERVDTKLLRALMARSVKLVRTDVPRRKVEVDYSAFRGAVEGNAFLNILGVTEVDAQTVANHFPYLITDVAKALGESHWKPINDIINRIRRIDGIDIKASDNNYHIAIKSGKNSSIHHYSEAFIELAKSIRNGENYVIKT